MRALLIFIAIGTLSLSGEAKAASDPERFCGAALGLQPDKPKYADCQQMLEALDPDEKREGKVAADDATCKAWHQKALAGRWFTSDEAEAFGDTDSTEEELKTLPACKKFFELQEKCQSYWADLFLTPMTSLSGLL